MKKSIFAAFKIEKLNLMKRLFYVVVITATYIMNVSAQKLEDGIMQLENENYGDAMKTFIKLNVMDPKNTIYQYYIGEVNYALENYEGARTAFNKGLEVSSKCDACRVGLAKLDLDNGNFQEAKKQIDAALKGNSKNHFIHALAGDAYLKSKNPRAIDALPLLVKARDIDPSVAKYWIKLGDAYFLNNDLGNAMNSYETAVKKDKNDPETYVKMARIWSSSKQYDLAIDRLEASSKISPNYALAYKELIELYIRAGKYDKVLPVLEKYVALAGSDIDAKVRLTKFLCFQAKDYPRAIEEGKKILVTNPEQYSVHRWLAWSYFESGKFQEAFDQSKLLFDAIEKDPARKSYSSDYEYYAKAAANIKRMDIADAMYAKLIEKDSTRSEEIYGMLAKSNYDNKNYKDAILWYDKKNAIKPLSNTELYYNALALYYESRYAESDAVFAKVVEKTPNYAQGWLMRARCANGIDPDGIQFLAKPFYEKYIEFASVDREKNKKNLIEANKYIGYYYVKQNDKANAKLYFEQVTSLDPADQEAVNNLTILNK